MSIEDATRLYRQADYPRALTTAAACSNTPDAIAAMLIMAKCFVAQGSIDGLGRVIDLARQVGGTPPEHTLFRILGSCLQQDGLYMPLVALEGKFPEGALLYPIVLYHASCARMMLGDEMGAERGFDKFRLAMPAYLQRLPLGTDDAFNTMFRQGTLVLSREATGPRLVQGRAMAPTQTDVEMIRPPASKAGPMFLCCADALYVTHFLPRWLPLLAPFGKSVHVHIIDPTPESLALVEQMAHEHAMADRLSASTSRDLRGTATSYACARFEIAPILLAALGRPLIAIDIDSGATPALDALADALPEVDYAGFETERCEPASVHPAGVMVFMPTDRGQAFVRDLAAYCRPKLDLPVRLNWMLDQAALYSVIRYHREHDRDFRYAALNRTTGQPMTAHIHGLASDEEKQAIKAISAGLGGADPRTVTEASWTP